MFVYVYEFSSEVSKYILYNDNMTLQTWAKERDKKNREEEKQRSKNNN